MPSIVQLTDFESGPLRIPNAVSGNAGEAANADLLEVIAQSEKEVLLGALGKTQYDAFQAAMAVEPLVEPYLSLKAQVTPMLKYFIFCAWLRYDEVNYTTVGGGKGSAQGQTMADLNSRFVYAWNNFVRLYCEIDGIEPSLYEYLRDTDGLSEADFRFSYQYANQFGL